MTNEEPSEGLKHYPQASRWDRPADILGGRRRLRIDEKKGWDSESMCRCLRLQASTEVSVLSHSAWTSSFFAPKCNLTHSPNFMAQHSVNLRTKKDRLGYCIKLLLF